MVPTSDVVARNGRAAALPPAERRAAIVAATLPLLHRHGRAVTTRQIAEAAGVAEGTIFRVFPDKDSLIAAAVEQAFDTAPLEAALGDIDACLPLEARLLAAVEVLLRRATTIWQLLSVVGTDAMPERGRRPGASPEITGLVALFEPDRHRLRLEPRAAAELFRGLTLAGNHPALISDRPLEPAVLVSLFLDGVRAA